MTHDFFAICARGLEDLVADELAGLEAQQIRPTRAGVRFAGDLSVGYAACLWSRVASRILLQVDDVAGDSTEALYEGVAAIPWEEHIDPSGTLAVDLTEIGHAVDHSHYAVQRVKDAIVDRLRDRLGVRPSIDPRDADLRVHVHVKDGRAELAIDLSGAGLHRRGYRAPGAVAPLRETVAAAMLARAGWGALAQAPEPALIDPMCGTGTLLAEGALIALDQAPGLGRERYGFLGWRGHDAERWGRVRREAAERGEAGRARPLVLVANDADAVAVRHCVAALRVLGLADRVRATSQSVEAWTPDLHGVSSGLFVVNPPYGLRLSGAAASAPAYMALGRRLRASFPGFRAAVLVEDEELGHALGLRAERVHVLDNANVRCRLLHFAIPDASVEGASTVEGASSGAGPKMLADRLRKNLRQLRRFAEREGTEAYRVYDADLPEYAVAVDRYGDQVCVQEYAPPKTIDPGRAARRLREAVTTVSEVLEVPLRAVHLKVRRRTRHGTQIEKQADTGTSFVVDEDSMRFRVNLVDQLDTGLFLEQRGVRAFIRAEARGRTFLNLFGYTGTASVAAALGGARSTTTVDLSNTYLDWAAANFRENGLEREPHRLIRADVLRWLDEPSSRFDLVYVNPPVFSRSKAMLGTFDLARDHVALLRRVLAKTSRGGTVVFCTHLRGFKLDREGVTEALVRWHGRPAVKIADRSHDLLPKDFSRSAGRFWCYVLSGA